MTTNHEQINKRNSLINNILYINTHHFSFRINFTAISNKKRNNKHYQQNINKFRHYFSLRINFVDVHSITNEINNSANKT